jgi:hypothetical protein
LKRRAAKAIERAASSGAGVSRKHGGAAAARGAERIVAPYLKREMARLRAAAARGAALAHACFAVL